MGFDSAISAEIWNAKYRFQSNGNDGDADLQATWERVAAAIAEAVMERWFSPQFRRERQDELAGWRNLFLRSDAAGYVGTCATLRDTDLTSRISAIALPALVVAGAEDGALPLGDVRACADAIPGTRFTALAGAGHIPSIEQPEALAMLMADFLKEVGHG